jgi:protein phosphatase
MANQELAMQEAIEAARSERSQGPARAPRRLRVTSYGLTDPGRQRPVNEDQFAIAEVHRVLQVQQSSIPQPEALLGDTLGHLLIVADGMGGHRAGQYASAFAVVGVESLVFDALGWLGRLQGEGVIRELHEALQTTDRWVAEASVRQAELQGMGTTLTMAYATDGAVYVAHVGDSRCYRWRQGQLERLTRDHTLVEQLVAAGALTPEEAAHHEMRNVVTNAVGGGIRGVSPDVQKHDAAPGDQLLLCTDGLTNVVSDEELAAVLARELAPAEICRLLVDAANDRGGPDNITAVIARFEDALQ